MKRVEGVDALRGLLACGVMMYHFLSWQNVPFYEQYAGVFEVLAISFVEVFFIISGFSLFYIYNNKLNSFKEIREFFRRRFFRIAPLFYSLLILVVTIKIGMSFVGLEVNRPLDFYLLFINFTFLFGLVNPADSLVVSGWSVGVEMAMYLFFPLLLVWCRTWLRALLVFTVLLFISMGYSALFLQTSLSIEAQWSSYVFFGNHISFFVMGFLVFFIFKKYEHLRIKRLSYYCLVLWGIVLVALYINISPNVEDILIGYGKIILLFFCGFLVLFFALNGIKNKFLLHIGDLSYSIYLGHFFVFLVMERIFDESFFIIVFSLIGTYFFALFTYKYIEIPMIRIGKRKG